MTSILVNLKDWLKNWFYTEDEIDAMLITNNIVENYPLSHLETSVGASQHEINLAIDSMISQGGGGGTALACVSDFSIDTTDVDNVQLYLTACEGKVITEITKVSVGNVDTYTIHYNDGTTYDFTVTNGTGSVYNIELDSSTYTTTGSLTVTAYLEENYEPKTGATVTFTGGVSTVTATTDSDGYATATVTFSQDGTLTATYNNASATATVTVQTSVLFYDDCSVDNSSVYEDGSLQTSSYTNYLPLTYSSDGYYSIQSSRNEGNHYAKWIPVLTGEDNLTFSCEVNTSILYSANRLGIVVGDANAYKSERFQFASNVIEHQTFVGTTETRLHYQTISSVQANTWYKMEFTVQGTSFTFKLYDMNDNELYTYSSTFQSSVITSSTTKKYGLYYLNYYPNAVKYYRNIKAESL